MARGKYARRRQNRIARHLASSAYTLVNLRALVKQLGLSGASRLNKAKTARILADAGYTPAMPAPLV